MLLKLIDEDLIFVNPQVNTKEELFSFFAEKAFKKGLTENVEDFEYGLLDREAQGNTELKPGIAIPHAKLDMVKEPFIIICIFKNPLKYTPGFGRGVNIVILIGSPKMDNTYINILASLARLLEKEEFITELKRSDVPEDVLHSIKKFTMTDSTMDRGKSRYLVTLYLNIKFSLKMILGLLLEAGIQQPTMFYGENLSMKESFGIPIFRISSMDVKNTFSETKMIQGITDSKEAVIRIYNSLKNEGINIDLPGVGSLYSIELDYCFGGNNPDIDF
jgi:fructose-specific phosphotransferase system IIA component